MEGMTKRGRFIRFTSSPALPALSAVEGPVPSEVEGSAVEGSGDLATRSSPSKLGDRRTGGNGGNLILLPAAWTPIGEGGAEIAGIAEIPKWTVPSRPAGWVQKGVVAVTSTSHHM